MVIHRLGASGKVVVAFRVPAGHCRAQGSQGPKRLTEKGKMRFSTDPSVLYYYDQVKRFK